VCPSPDDTVYQAGLTEGHYCLMMLIQDGGANDADGKANGTIVDPGGLATPVSAPPTPPVTPPTTSDGSGDSGGGGGCAINTDAEFDPLLVLMLLLASGQLIRRRILDSQADGQKKAA
jgi:hypothetical protein